MDRYEVVRPWHGVKVGQVVEMDTLHPALKSNVRLLRGQAAELVPATPSASTEGKPLTKGEIAKRLKELGVEFNGRATVGELLQLLPDDDPLKPVTE